MVDDSRADIASIAVDLVSDIICPWCYVGFRHFLMAWKERPDVPVALTFRAWQLDPSIPSDGVDRRERLIAKFGHDMARLAAINAALEEAGKAAGISFAFDRAARTPNTLNCHRLIRWANGTGLGIVCAEALFEACHVSGRDLTSADVLADIAADIGMDGPLVMELLASDRDTDAVHAEVAAARRMGITAVPTFIFNNQIVVTGAQPPQVLVQAIDQALGFDPARAGLA
jgi:predicted DsbA family dithiol-disulfide isomerase